MKGLATSTYREMRVLTRGRFLYLQRFLNLILPTVYVFTHLMSSGFDLEQVNGLEVLVGTTILCSFMAWIMGILSVADCISSEKREGTIGLLMMTPLKAYEILLGKWLSNSLSYLFNILALVPLFTILLINGGITLLDVVESMVAIYANFFLASCIGLLISARTEESRTTWMAAMSAILVGIAAMLFVSSLMPFNVRGIPRPMALAPQFMGIHLHPTDFITRMSFWINGIPSPTDLLDFNSVWIHAFFWGLISVRLLMMASSALRQYWKTEMMDVESLTQPDSRAVRFREFLQRASHPLHTLALERRNGAAPGTDGKEDSPRPAHVSCDDTNPIEKFWLRNSKLPPWQLAVFGVYEAVFLTLLLCIFYVMQDRFSGVINWLQLCVGLLLLAMTFDMLFKFAAVMEICRKIIEDKANSGLELITTTPVPDDQMLAGMRRALNRLVRRYQITSICFFGSILALAVGDIILSRQETIYYLRARTDGLAGSLALVSLTLLIGSLFDWRHLIQRGIAAATASHSILGCSLRIFIRTTLIPYGALIITTIGWHQFIDNTDISSPDYYRRFLLIIPAFLAIKVTLFHWPAIRAGQKLRNFRSLLQSAMVSGHAGKGS